MLSGHGCAGLCGPRFRWEEDDAEKTIAAFSDNFSDTDALAWSWREATTLRVMDAYDFCLTNKPPRSSFPPGEKDTTPADSKPGTAPFEGIDKVFAAIGLGTGPHAARRGVLSDDLFESPPASAEAAHDEPDVVSPPPPVVHSRERRSVGPSGSLRNLPYPFTGAQAQISSEEAIPFPPSPEPDDGDSDAEGEEGGHVGEVGAEGEEEMEEGDEPESEVPSDGRRTSGSMSSLGRPVASRYPFDFRRQRGRGSLSSASHMSPHTVSTPRSNQTSTTPSRSTQSRSTHLSRSTQSTSNRESSDSPYPRSSNAPSPSSLSGSGIPSPPRHPQRRARAGTFPAPSVASSPSPGVAGRSRARQRADSARTRTESAITDTSMTFGPGAIPLHFGYDSDEERPPDESLMDVPEAEGSVEEAEQNDSVGLLSAGTSPRASRTSLVNLRHLSGGAGHHRRSNGSRSRSGTNSHSGSGSGSRSRSISTASRSESARSRAQSFIHSLGAASRSSLDLVRSRANSMARLSDSPYYSSSPDPIPSSPENYTFGHPLRAEWREGQEGQSQGSRDVIDLSELPAAHSAPRSRSTSGNVPVIPEETSTPTVTVRRRLTSDTGSALSEPQIERTEQTDSGEPTVTASAPLEIPGRAMRAAESMPDISTANQSLVTAPPTVQGTTESSGRTPSSWDTMRRIPPEQRGTFEPA